MANPCVDHVDGRHSVANGLPEPRQSIVNSSGGQATKGIRWMPWHQEAMKDVVSCDKPRGAANERRSADFRMGKPLRMESVEPRAEYR